VPIQLDFSLGDACHFFFLNAGEQSIGPKSLVTASILHPAKRVTTRNGGTATADDPGSPADERGENHASE